MTESGGIDVRNSGNAYWEELESKVNKAVVFLDDNIAECLHWCGGVMRLFNAGAVDVKQFSSFESGYTDQDKGVFVISGPLTQQSIQTQTLRHIVEASKFRYAIVISTLSPGMHTVIDYGQGTEEMRGFYALEELLPEWMGNMNYTAEVHYLPLIAAPITDQLFVLPGQNNFFPLLPNELDSLLQKLKKDKPAAQHGDLEFHNADRELQLQLKLLTCSINSMLETLGVSEDLYAIGHTSRIIATELASLPWAKGRRKVAQNKASILFVDRTLDIASVVNHQIETLSDKMFTVLPKMESQNIDVCVNMAPLCSVVSNSDNTVVAPGCLAHTADHVASSLFKFFTTAKHKESLMELNRRLVEAADTAGLPLRLSGRPGRVSAEQLETHINLFKEKLKPIKKNCGLLQLALGTVQTLQSGKLARLDALLAAEKGLLPCLSDADGNSAILQIIHKLQQDLSSEDINRREAIENNLLLALYIYALSEWEVSRHEENGLQAVLEKAIMTSKDDDLPECLCQLLGQEKNEESALIAVEEIFTRLNAVYRTRQQLNMFGSVYDTDTMATQPLLRQLVEKVLDPSKPELPDIVYKSTGFRDLLKSGFGLFMNVSKPRPSDHPLLIIFVVGGTTTTELRQIREAVTASKSKIQVILGSTTILRPTDLLNRALVQDNLHPETHLLL